MKKVLISLAAAGFLIGMGATIATAQQDTTVVHKQDAYGDSKTVVHKESADGEHSKTMVAREDGSKTIVKRGRHHVKRVDIEPNGDKTITKKEKDAD